LSRYDLKIALLERNPDVCMGASGKNSAVVHAGFNNRAGSLMAELCVKGNMEFENLCQTLDAPYKKTGKLVVALDESDLPIIDDLLEAGQKNGCEGLTKIGRAEMTELEPLASGAAALYSSNTAIINPFLYVFHLAEAAMQNGAEIYLNSEVTAIERSGGKYSVCAGDNVFSCSRVINAAGLYADKIAAMAGDTQYRIYPSRGEYFILDKQASELVARPIYPVPRKGAGGLGVHLTTTIDGNMLIGPSAEYVSHCEDYASTQRMMDKLFEEAQALLPQLERNLIIGAYTGIRAKTVPPGGGNFGDFIIEESHSAPGVINLIGIESPGLTASMPIARRVCEMLQVRCRLAEKAGWEPVYRANPVFRSLDMESQNNLIRENPDYGEIICRCENITKAEVLNALNNPLGARTLTAVKNRVRTMTGRCQGGYCLPHIVDILTNEMGIPPNEITFRNIGDAPFFGRCK
jgi:glycerol-3-phosphate dehydrogenase